MCHIWFNLCYRTIHIFYFSKYEFDYTDVGLHTEDGIMLVDENEGIPILFEDFEINSIILDENDMYQEKGLEILNFSEIDPFAEGGRY